MHSVLLEQLADIKRVLFAWSLFDLTRSLALWHISFENRILFEVVVPHDGEINRFASTTYTKFSQIGMLYSTFSTLLLLLHVPLIFGLVFLSWSTWFLVQNSVLLLWLRGELYVVCMYYWISVSADRSVFRQRLHFIARLRGERMSWIPVEFLNFCLWLICLLGPMHAPNSCDSLCLLRVIIIDHRSSTCSISHDLMLIQTPGLSASHGL